MAGLLYFSLVRGYWIFSVGLFPIYILLMSFPIYLMGLWFFCLLFNKLEWGLLYCNNYCYMDNINIFHILFILVFFNLPGIQVYIFPYILLWKFWNTESWNHFTVNTHITRSRFCHEYLTAFPTCYPSIHRIFWCILK